MGKGQGEEGAVSRDHLESLLAIILRVWSWDQQQGHPENCVQAHPWLLSQFHGARYRGVVLIQVCSCV